MAEEEKKAVEFAQLSPEMQDDVIKEHDEASDVYAKINATVWEAYATIGENIERINAGREMLAKERDAVLGMPMGPESAKRAREYVKAVNDLTEANKNQGRAVLNFSRGRKELEEQEKKLTEIRRKIGI